MSANTLTIAQGRTFNRHALRYAFGATFIMAVAMAMTWKLAYMLPVLSLSFLASGKPAPTLKAGLNFVLTIAAACFAGVFFSKLFLPFPLVFFSLVFLLMLHLFYASQLPPFLKTWLMLALLLIPMIGSQSIVLAETVAINIAIGALLTIGLIWLIFAFFPEPSADSEESVAPKPATPLRSPRERFNTALKSTLVVFPVLFFFQLFEWSGAILILIFIALLSMQPGFAKNYKAGLGLILGNLIGGLAAIGVYELLVIVPEYPFMLLLILLSGLLLAPRVFSGKPTAAIFGMAFSTLMLVIGSTTGGSGEADSEVWSRILQIMIAVIYVVLAFGWMDKMTNKAAE